MKTTKGVKEAFASMGYKVEGGDPLKLRGIEDDKEWEGVLMHSPLPQGLVDALRGVEHGVRRVAAYSEKDGKGYVVQEWAETAALPVRGEETAWRVAIEVILGLHALHEGGWWHGGITTLYTVNRHYKLGLPSTSRCPPESDMQNLGALLDRCAGSREMSDEFCELVALCSKGVAARELLQWDPVAYRVETAYYLTENRKIWNMLVDKERELSLRQYEVTRQERALALREARLSEAYQKWLQDCAAVASWHRGCTEWVVALMDWKDSVALPEGTAPFPAGAPKPPPLPLPWDLPLLPSPTPTSPSYGPSLGPSLFSVTAGTLTSLGTSPLHPSPTKSDVSDVDEAASFASAPASLAPPCIRPITVPSVRSSDTTASSISSGFPVL